VLQLVAVVAAAVVAAVAVLQRAAAAVAVPERARALSYDSRQVLSPNSAQQP
jgi:hypothetical protein